MSVWRNISVCIRYLDRQVVLRYYLYLLTLSVRVTMGDKGSIG